jgi:ribonuclease D
MPVENLLTPETVRRLCWSPPDPADEATVAAILVSQGARSWQVEACLPVLLTAMAIEDAPEVTDE